MSMLIIPSKSGISGNIEEAKKYTDAQIEKMLGGVSDKLDTLKELADAINNDPDFYSNIVNQIESKASKEDLLYSNENMSEVTNLKEAIDFLAEKQASLILDWSKIENKPDVLSSIQHTDEGILFLSDNGQQISSILSINEDDIDLILSELI